MDHESAANAAASLANGDAATVFSVGLDILNADYPEELLPAAQTAASRFPGDPRIHQLLGLAARATGRSALALEAFATAAQLDPRNALIAHSHARAALEAGRTSSHLFDGASSLNPQDGSVLLGRAAARLQEGDPRRAIEELRQIVAANPMWIDGHRGLAQLLAQQGMDPAASVTEALARSPKLADLQHLLISLRLQAGDLEAADRAAQSAQEHLGTAPWLPVLRAHISSEMGDTTAADRQFTASAGPASVHEASLFARHAIRARRPEVAIDLLETWIAQDRDNLLWPYLSLGWRMTGNPRWQWLEGDSNLVGVYDLAERIGDIGGLVEHLRRLHSAIAPPLDQSVRGGTQTDGNLLLRDEPPIRALRAILLETVTAHVARLPAAEPGHPTKLVRRTPIRVSGSWSVRLRDGGFHTDHVHSQGWLSSAFYVSLPDNPNTGLSDHSHQGWLSLGECRDLVPELEPVRLIEPRPGRLVLFPSTVWHGTRPFPVGERMTVAFDIALPKQS